MIDRYIQRLLDKHGNSDHERTYLIRMGGFVGILANVAFAVIKLIVGSVSNSIAITSDAINNLTDATASVITLIGLKIARHRPDHKHPLGYGRIEYISGMIISTLVLVTGIQFLMTSIQRIELPQTTRFSVSQLLILCVVMLGKWALSRLDLAIGNKMDSDSLIAAGTDAKMDVMVSGATILTGMLSKYLNWHIDGYTGVALSLFIIYNGCMLIRQTISNILGERPSQDIAAKIKAEVLKYEPIIGAYDLLLHNYGPATKVGTLNVEMPDDISVEAAYEAMTAARQDILKLFGIYITFGLYSVNTYDEKIVALRGDISDIVTAIPGAISIHNFRYDQNQHQFRFDAVVGFGISDFTDFTAHATSAIRARYPDADVVINIDMDYA